MLLRSTVRYSEDLPTVSGEESEQLSNILALGLRNPWKFFEVNDSLYIFDVGLYNFEELNVLKYESLPGNFGWPYFCLLYTSPSPRDRQKSRMPSSA